MFSFSRESRLFRDLVCVYELKKSAKDEREKGTTRDVVLISLVANGRKGATEKKRIQKGGGEGFNLTLVEYWGEKRISFVGVWESETNGRRLGKRKPCDGGQPVKSTTTH